MRRESSSVQSLILIFVSLLFIAQPSWAGRVVKVKGNKVFIVLSPDEVGSVSKGDKFLLTTKEGKKTGIIMIRALKGNKAIAQLGKGKAARGMYTQARGGAPKAAPAEGMESADEVAQAETGGGSTSALRFGLLGAFGTASQDVAGFPAMSGSTMGAKGLIDYSLFDSLGLRARVGMDMFSVAGTSDANVNYETSITYLTVDLLLRYYLLKSSSFGVFVNGGLGIYSPMTTDLGTNQALQEDSISTTSLLIFGGGVTFPVGGFEVFAGADYFYFPPSEDVSTSAIAGKVGLLFSL